MGWRRVSRWVEEADTGHRVVAAYAPAGWRFLAYAPPIPYDQIKPRLRVRYGLGERVPATAELLGCYPTAARARQACEAHAVPQLPLDGAGDLADGIDAGVARAGA